MIIEMVKFLVAFITVSLTVLWGASILEKKHSVMINFRKGLTKKCRIILSITNVTILLVLAIIMYMINYKYAVTIGILYGMAFGIMKYLSGAMKLK